MCDRYHTKTPQKTGLSRRYGFEPRRADRSSAQDWRFADRSRSLERRPAELNYSLMSKSTVRFGALFLAESTACRTSR
jgi:hypothetical protein